MRTNNFKVRLGEKGEGELELPAYHLGNGLYLHKQVVSGEVAHTDLWTLSVALGIRLVHIQAKVSASRIIASATKYMMELDWSYTIEKMQEHVLSNPTYREAIYNTLHAIRDEQANRFKSKAPIE